MRAIRAALYLHVWSRRRTTSAASWKPSRVRDGWTIPAVFTDGGVSGAKGRDLRPGFDWLCQWIARRDFDLVAAWSVDRLGRSLRDLVTFLGESRAKGVDLYLHRQGIDTGTPVGKAMFGVVGFFAEFERAMIVERVNAGLARARAEGKRLGRPSNLTEAGERRARDMLAEGTGVVRVGKALGIGTVRRVKAVMDRRPPPR